MTSALALENIDCTFTSREDVSQRYTALRGATLRVAEGEFVSVVGPTGCGKSTLLNVAAGLLRPSAGSVKVFGELLSGINSRAGYMFQAEALMPWRDTIENVVAGLEFRRVGREEAAARGRDWLKRVGLAGFEKRFPHQLSGGMRKRVALAQMLILNPQILLMDEPFSALDIQTRQLMENELLELWGRTASRWCSLPTIWKRRSPCPTASWCSRPGRSRTPSGITRSTCRVRATWRRYGLCRTS